MTSGAAGQAERRRTRVSNGLLWLMAMVTFIAGPIFYLSTVISEEDAFVALANDTLRHPLVRQEVADQVSTVTFEALADDQTIADALPTQARTFTVPLTRIASQQVTAAAFGLLETEVGQEAVDASLREVHGQLIADDDEVTIDLRAVLVRTSREIGGPAVGAAAAKVVGTSDFGRYTLSEEGTASAAVVAATRTIPAIGAVLAVAVLALLVVGVAIAPDWRRALVRAGVAMASGAVLSMIVVTVVLFAVLVESDSTVGLGVAEVLSTDFNQQQRGVVLNGLVLASLGVVLGHRPAASALRRLPADLWHRRPEAATNARTLIGDNPALTRILVWAAGIFLLASWSNPTWRVLVTVLALTLGAQALIWRLGPDEAASANTSRVRGNLAALTVAGLLFWPGWSLRVVLVAFVVGSILQVLPDLPEARRAARAAAQPAAGADGRPDEVGGLARLGWAAAALVVGGIGAALTLGSNGAVAAGSGCNGHEELCDRPVDEVVFAGSHNAMSSTDLGWDLAMQTGDIVQQLDHGVRALLIDTLYWDSTGTVEGGEDLAASTVIEAALSDDVPKPGVWLCHGFCALGATDAEAALIDIRLWLEAHPREVLMIIVQDEVSAADSAALFERTGIVDLTHVHQPGSPWPTLGDLIDADERILLYGENQGEAGTYFQNAWETAFTETPFTFDVPADFSCEPNRGKPDNELFLINHWVTTGIPVREAAASINGRDRLLDRVNACEEETGRRPNVLAVDFAETGDLIAVVDELNRVAGG